MVAVVSVETVLLVILVVLVAGLLRSHAEILRRLGQSPTQPPSTPDRADTTAPILAGTTPGGDAVTLAFDGAGRSPTLLAFLTSGCGTCATFWRSSASGACRPGCRP